MPHIVRPLPQKKESQARVNRIIFFEEFETLLALYVVAFCLVNDETVLKRGNVFFDRFRVDFPARRDHSVGDSFCGNRTSDAVEYEAHYAFKHFRIADFAPRNNIF